MTVSITIGMAKTVSSWQATTQLSSPTHTTIAGGWSLKLSAPLRLIKTTTYIWDNWDIIREIVREGDSVAVTDNVWGLDIDGTLQGAGGVGGLLAVIRDDGVFLPAYDANGNITEYVATNGVVVAHYEYSAFGEPTVSSGELASSFTHQFSTKPYCAVTGFNEYQMRKYRPVIGRWMSRDPMGEAGGRHIYTFVSSNPFNSLDLLGLLGNPVCGPNGCYYPPDPCWGNCPNVPSPTINNPCAEDEKMAQATDTHNIGLLHLLERLPLLKGTKSLFNYLEFSFACDKNEKAENAQIRKTVSSIDRDELYFNTANPDWVPGNPKYKCGGGLGRVSVQTRIWWKFLPESTGGEVFANLSTIVVVCYKCKCDKGCGK